MLELAPQVAQKLWRVDDVREVSREERQVIVDVLCAERGFDDELNASRSCSDALGLDETPGARFSSLAAASAQRPHGEGRQLPGPASAAFPPALRLSHAVRRMIRQRPV